MPAFIVAALQFLVGLLVRYGGAIALNVLVFFGLKFVGQNYVVTPFVTFIENSLAGAPAMVIQSLASVNFDKAVTIILSAYATAASGRLLLRRSTTP